MTIAPGETPIKPEDFLPESRNVSNSEVTTFLSCKRMYDFAFIENLEPIETNRALSRGTVGHHLFEQYIAARLRGVTHEESMDYAKSTLMHLVQSQQVSLDVAMEAQMLVDRYHAYHRGWPEWELLGTEERADLKLTDTLNIAIRYDLMFRELSSRKIFIGDWKFTYDFWLPKDHALNAQMPKYIAVMRANDYQIDGGFIFEIRTRKLGRDKAADAKNLWRATRYYPQPAQLTRVMRQHVLAATEIEKHRALDETVRKEYASIPVLNKYGPCKYCAFSEPCDALNKGANDISLMLETQFKTNTYGYNHEVKEEVGF